MSTLARLAIVLAVVAGTVTTCTVATVFGQLATKLAVISAQ
jgi:hypothetical protein